MFLNFLNLLLYDWEDNGIIRRNERVSESEAENLLLDYLPDFA